MPSCAVTMLAAAVVGTSVLAGCAAGLPEGKPWTVDASAWFGSQECSAAGCRLSAYATRTFSTGKRVPDALQDGATVQVHCFVPTPAPQRDPSGRDVHRWYLVTADGAPVWAPDVLLTSANDLRLDAEAPGTHLASGLRVCHSSVPGR